jgi:dTDP-4-dehydrorhamnose reductase
MRVLIFGATGLLGKALIPALTGYEVRGLGSKDADIRDESEVRATVEAFKPDWIVLAAAYTDVDGCETNQELAFAVNAQGAANVARVAKEFGARLLFVSTDYVFDGSKTSPYEVEDVRSPRSVYGRSKAEAEVELEGTLPESCIVRTSWLYGMGGKCFPDTILNLAASRPALDVVNDQRGSPTYTVDRAKAIVELCRKDVRGIVHTTNRGECTWFDFAREIVAGAGLPTEVRPTTSEKFVRPAERPKYSVLSPARLESYGVKMPGWRDALRRYLAERSASDQKAGM